MPMLQMVSYSCVFGLYAAKRNAPYTDVRLPRPKYAPSTTRSSESPIPLR